MYSSIITYVRYIILDRKMKLIILFLIIFSCTVPAQTKKIYKPVKKCNTSIVNKRIKRSTTTFTPVVKDKQVAVINTINKNGVPTKSYITYKKKRVVYWKAKRKNVYLPIVK